MATNIDSVRLLIADLDPGNQLFTDVQLALFLTIEGDNVKRAAASALDAMATSEAMVSKVIKDRSLSTDGAKLADAIRKHAAQLREQADVDDDDFAFEIVEFDQYDLEYPGLI